MNRNLFSLTASTSFVISSRDKGGSAFFRSFLSNSENSFVVLDFCILIRLRFAKLFRMLFAFGFIISILKVSIFSVYTYLIQISRIKMNYTNLRGLGTGWVFPILIYSNPISFSLSASGIFRPSNTNAGLSMLL